MNTIKSPVHNMALLQEPRHRWPLKADYLDVPREKAVAIVESFVTHFGFGYLRERGAFRFMAPILPARLDVFDLYEALKAVFDTVNGYNWGDTESRAFKERLEDEFGPLTGHIAIRLQGRCFVIAAEKPKH
ncbi:hypothetical protein G4G28_09670 [Massilia sp. Dwa41.01b]|uniref:hypothetical protein n=1 Tax=unclassified Massilia TaxID=2609279 RepID=UPI0016026DC1|nr:MULTISPECIES: hypothetical protein [unclassified Massilia]QNA88690.1 hypothetical protein G4G28_09670 [Massilia sp. Dwa41.01b]QNA99590.1 hypothetical protein G4G31_13345 [Massilia sp. Se16.2.3]